MPYCWGGRDTLTSFVNGLAAGGRAGNINCPSSGWVGNTFGVDCSGYVGNCWGLTTKYSTNTLLDVSTAISASSLQQGDALDYAGSHVVLFNCLDGAGNYNLYEATCLNDYDKVANTLRPISSMGAYQPIRFNGIQ